MWQVFSTRFRAEMREARKGSEVQNLRRMYHRISLTNATSIHFNYKIMKKLNFKNKKIKKGSLVGVWKCFTCLPLIPVLMGLIFCMTLGKSLFL